MEKYSKIYKLRGNDKVLVSIEITPALIIRKLGLVIA
jgi:hypothetical protein